MMVTDYLTACALGKEIVQVNGLDGAWFVSGSNCVPRSSYVEMLATKERFHKTDGRQFYHFVQSFSTEEDLTPQEVNAIGLEFAQRQFPGFEVVIATHMDTNHLHNHLVVNSVSCADGHKLHQNRDDSWKLDLIQAINEALEWATDRESFIACMEYEGYEVAWTDTRKHITFTCPNGRKCRDSSLHDETLLKENLEALFAFRKDVGFVPSSTEPEIGWMGELAEGWIHVLARLERDSAQSDLPVTPTWTDSKQRRREMLKKMAMGQKFSGYENYEPTM